MAIYEFKVDTLRTGTYAASIDDLSSRVLSLDWNDGMADSYDQFAPPARLKVNLENIDGVFNSDTLGAELVANGNFATWSGDDPSSWTVTGEVASDPYVNEVAADQLAGGAGTGACNLYSTSAALSIAQTILTAGTTYRVSLDISASSEATGYIGVYNGTTLISPRYHLTGSYVFYFNATGTSFKIETTGAVDMTIDNVSVKATSKYGFLLTRGMLCQLTVNVGVKFIGRLSRKDILPGSYGRRIAVLEFTDPMLELLDTEYQPPLQTNVTVDVAMAKIFDDAIAPFPYSAAYWMLGTQGASELGLTTTIYAPPAYSFETGVTTLNYVGDNQHEGGGGIQAQTFLRNMVDAEVDGRFYYNGHTGAFTFHNRHHDTLNALTSEPITDADFEADMSSFLDSADLINLATLSYRPRKVGTAGSVIWNADNLPITIRPLDTFKTTARYRDATLKNARIGAMDTIVPVPGTDFVVTDESGASANSSLGVHVTFNANSAAIVLINTVNEELTINTLQLRGTPLQTFDNRSVEARNDNSERASKYLPATYSIPALDDDDFAQQAVTYRVRKFSTPNTRFQSVGFIANNSSTRAGLIEFGVGDIVNVTDSWTGHNSDYFIVGSRHSVVMGGEHTHSVTFILKPRSPENFWVLGVAGYSELNTTTRLAL